MIVTDASDTVTVRHKELPGIHPLTVKDRKRFE